MGQEKRIRSAVEKNRMNMLYSSIVQRQKEEGEEGRIRESTQDKIRVRGNSGVAIRGRRVEHLGSGVDQDILPSVNTPVINTTACSSL